MGSHVTATTATNSTPCLTSRAITIPPTTCLKSRAASARSRCSSLPLHADQEGDKWGSVKERGGQPLLINQFHTRSSCSHNISACALTLTQYIEQDMDCGVSASSDPIIFRRTPLQLTSSPAP